MGEQSKVSWINKVLFNDGRFTMMVSRVPVISRGQRTVTIWTGGRWTAFCRSRLQSQLLRLRIKDDDCIAMLENYLALFRCVWYQ